MTLLSGSGSVAARYSGVQSKTGFRMPQRTAAGNFRRRHRDALFSFSINANAHLQAQRPCIRRILRRCHSRGCSGEAAFQPGQTGRVPRTARTIQISKHAPTIRKLGRRAIPRLNPKKLKMALATAAPTIPSAIFRYGNPMLTLHELFCRPACKSANDNGCNPAYLWIRS